MGALRLSPQQRSRLDEELTDQVIQRYRWGVGPAVAIAGVFALTAWKVLATVPVWVRIGPPLAIAWILLLLLPATYVRRLRPRFDVVQVFGGSLIVGCIGVHAAYTGGFGSPVAPALFLVWVFGATVTPLSARLFAGAVVVHFALMLILVFWLAPDPGSPHLFLPLAVGIGGFSVLGSFLRDHGRVRLFLAREQVDQLNAELEKRVSDQVIEIVARAKEVEALNAELRQKVQERSRELAEALRRLGDSDAADETLREGDELGGRARIVRLLAKGGMGAVYLAEDRIIGAPVAVKLLAPGVATDKTALERFLSEAAAAAAIAHPGVVKTLHVDVTEDGRLYQVMEYVDGVTLDRLIERGRVPAGHAARIGAEVARALSAAHRMGIIHRDIKPSNLILSTREPGVCILDFGVSKVVQDELERTRASLTGTQQMLGTPAYMSPEQVRGAATVGSASDVYSLGLVLYELVAGTRPYEGVTGPALYAAHLAEEPRPLTEVAAAVPPELARLIHRCLAKKPTDRPKAADLVFHLTHVADQLKAAAALDIARDVMAADARATVRPGQAAKAM